MKKESIAGFKRNKMQLTLLLLLLCGISFITSLALAKEAKTAKQAWTNLVGEKMSKRPEFAFIQNNLSVPNVLIYGDSISIHYTQRVRKNLADRANVYRLYRNGSDSNGMISKMQKMHSIMQDSALQNPWTFNWDVIHFNVGLHDLKYVKDGKLDKINGQQVSSIKQYQSNLRNIIIYLKQLAPKASLVFATTTPVPEEADGRVAGDAAKYNQAALQVLQDFPEVVVNDLYQFTKPNQESWWVKPGDVHYNSTGTNAQGDQVSNVILKAKIFL